MFGWSLTGCSGIAYRRSRVLFTKPVGLIGYRDDADALLPRVRDTAKRQHSTVPGAHSDGRRRAAGGVLRGARALRAPRRPHEYFDPDRHANIVERLAFREMPDGAAKPNPLWHPETYDQYLAWALEEGTSANGVFGAKIMWGYLGDFAELLRGIEGMAGRPLPELLGRAFPGLRYIQITRENKIRQAVSLWKAVQTQAWKGRRRGRALGRARVLVSRDQLPRAAADRARRLLGRVLPRPRLRAVEAHLRGARREHRRGHPARARSTSASRHPPTSASAGRSYRCRLTRSPRNGCDGWTSTCGRSRRPSRPEAATDGRAPAGARGARAGPKPRRPR